ncbi:MAG: hypothetical protein IBJ11_12670 [Phycisphaerales bacterium]|nr:hypothetical protein [Phycisphaerales bacterium]
MTTDTTRQPNPAELRTRIGRSWLRKMIVIAIFGVGLGVWGTLDAFWIYPARGREHTQFTLKGYLEAMQRNGRLSQASVPDPAAEYQRLVDTPPGSRSDLENIKLDWLRSLSRVYSLEQLKAENDAAAASGEKKDTRTVFPRPEFTLDDLTQKLAGQQSPKPLAYYDIPVQYLFMAVGFGLGLYLLVLVRGVASKVYRYDPAAKRLTLPGGKSFVPADIDEVDKRKWDKYFVFLKLRDGSPEIRLDLYRYEPLEDWVLEMEKLHPNYVEPEDDEDEDEGEGGEEAGAGAGEKAEKA